MHRGVSLPKRWRDCNVAFRIHRKRTNIYMHAYVHNESRNPTKTFVSSSHVARAVTLFVLLSSSPLLFLILLGFSLLSSADPHLRKPFRYYTRKVSSRRYLSRSVSVRRCVHLIPHLNNKAPTTNRNSRAHLTPKHGNSRGKAADPR